MPAHPLAASGVLRVAINLGNPVLAQGDAAAPRGVSVWLAGRLAMALGLPHVLHTYPSAGAVVDAVDADAWDLAFLAIDPLRADRIAFSAPYVEIEGTYLVREDSPARSVHDLDRHGVRIAVGDGAAYDLFLRRELREATLQRAPTSAAAIDLFHAQQLDAAAGVRQPLQAWAALHPGHRVLADRFTAIRQAVAVPCGRDARAITLLHAEVEKLKAGNELAEAFARSGHSDVSLVQGD
ncbi:MAG: transporter substrate-binding domain-containing protein [Stenotrophomonas sp.]|nr:transporter substrate-binding domain-containing protein [Stenotrophomonas sp.]